MRIHASVSSRKKDLHLMGDKGVGRLDLKADSEDDRDLLTSLWRTIGPPTADNLDNLKAGVAFIRAWMNRFPKEWE